RNCIGLELAVDPGAAPLGAPSRFVGRRPSFFLSCSAHSILIGRDLSSQSTAEQGTPDSFDAQLEREVGVGGWSTPFFFMLHKAGGFHGHRFVNRSPYALIIA
ncbi:unnamed protein product, partial [Scytosiphon promiscuus]